MTRVCGRLMPGLCSISVSMLLFITTPMLPSIARTDQSVDPQAVEGDLSHLAFTARSGLSARLIAPGDSGIVNSAAAAFEVATVAGAGVELAVNGEVVPLNKLGRRVELTDGSVHYTYYGIVLAPGSNRIMLTPLGADGLRGASTTTSVWGPGPPAAIHATGCSSARADGRTPCLERFAVVDAWGHPAVPGATLNVAVTDGDAALLPSAITGGELLVDGSPGHAEGITQRRSLALVLATGSAVTVGVIPGMLPGRIKLAAGSGTISTAVSFDARAFIRPPFVAGLATLGIGTIPGNIGADPTAADGTNSRSGRVALYGTGALSRTAVASVAYDTAGALAATPVSGSFNEDPNDRPYATYGDAATRRNDALTQDRLFSRIDAGYTSLMWGEFGATTGPAGTAGAAALQVDGARVALGSAVTSLDAFSANNRVGYGRDVLGTTGLALLNPLSHNNLVIGSEIVTLVSTDRRSGAIVRQTTLANVVDYSLDYISGMLRFINIPLPYDALFNPQRVLVTYEYSTLGSETRTTGARFDAPLTRLDGLHVGLGYLNDVSGDGNFTLVSENATGRLPGGSWTFSHAGSAGIVPGVSNANATGGSAFRFGATGTSGPYTFALGYHATSAAYGNPFGDLQTPGLIDDHVTLGRTLGGGRGEVALSYDRERQAAPGLAATQSNIALIAHDKIDSRLTVRGGLTLHGSDTQVAAMAPSSAAVQATPAITPATADQRAGVAQANLGVEWKALRNLALEVDRDQNVGSGDSTQPAQTTAQASWDLGGHGRIYARELWSDAPPRGLDWTPTAGAAAHAFALGIDQRVNANTSVESTYTIAGTGNGTDINAAIGIKEHLTISRLIKGDLFVQRGVGVGLNAASFDAYGASIGYGDANGGFKATGSLQDRTGFNGGATWSLGAAGKLARDFSLLVTTLGSRAVAVNATSDTRIALAWRPSKSDRGALLAGFERSAGNSGVSPAQTGVASLDGTYRLTRSLALTSRLARKIDGDSTYIAGTTLLGLGVRQQLGLRFDASVETRAILATAAGGQTRSTATEFGALLGDTMRAAMGYNCGSTDDPVLAAGPTRQGFYATLTTTIDRIFGWGAH